jgi:hypothetical protein
VRRKRVPSFSFIRPDAISQYNDQNTILQRSLPNLTKFCLMSLKTCSIFINKIDVAQRLIVFTKLNESRKLVLESSGSVGPIRISRRAGLLCKSIRTILVVKPTKIVKLYVQTMYKKSGRKPMHDNFNLEPRFQKFYLWKSYLLSGHEIHELRKLCKPIELELHQTIKELCKLREPTGFALHC